MATTRKPAAKTATTTKRKPAARKTTTRRTTKPAATQPVEAVETAPRQYTEEERQALLTTYSSLTSAGLPVPPEINDIVKGWVAEEQKRRRAEEAEREQYRQALAEENAAGPWYVRNGYTAPLSIRLDRQTEKRRIELKPRGVPGDMHPLEEKDLKDPVLKRNVNIGVCEIIPAGEANRILDKQTTNMTERVHTPTAILRNAKGEEYASGAVKTELEYNAQGVTVGVINPEQMQGKVEDKALKSDGGVVRPEQAQRQREVSSQFVPTGGNPAIIETGPINRNLAQDKIKDDLARRKRVEGPEAALAGMRVTVNPVQQS